MIQMGSQGQLDIEVGHTKRMETPWDGGERTETTVSFDISDNSGTTRETTATVRRTEGSPVEGERGTRNGDRPQQHTPVNSRFEGLQWRRCNEWIGMFPSYESNGTPRTMEQIEQLDMMVGNMKRMEMPDWNGRTRCARISTP